jgi:hypothetical protein
VPGGDRLAVVAEPDRYQTGVPGTGLAVGVPDLDGPAEERKTVDGRFGINGA